jgi:hypothetical protein
MSRTSFIAAALLTLGLAGGLLAFGPRSQTASKDAGCCGAGRLCCEQALPCCEQAGQTDCCELGGACCAEQAACCDSH